MTAGRLDLGSGWAFPQGTGGDGQALIEAVDHYTLW